MRTKNASPEPRKPTFIETARRAQIIACAIDTLAELGYAHASLAQIAKRAGIAKSVISYYFSGKDALMWAVIVEVYTHAGQFMWSKMEVHSNIKEMLRAYIESNLAYVRAHPKHAQALAEIVRNKTGKLSEDEPSEDVGIKPLEELLEAGQQAGEFREFDTRPMAVTIRKAIDGALDQWTTEPEIDIEAYAKELVTLFDLATRKTE